MVVFEVVVRPFIEHVGGFALRHKKNFKLSARLSRNLSSPQGRIDYVRVRLIEKEGEIWAQPILGKSGLINTMIKADGLIEIGINTEGLDKGTLVEVILL
jgi:molybdopterin molybdotransferase